MKPNEIVHDLNLFPFLERNWRWRMTNTFDKWSHGNIIFFSIFHRSYILCSMSDDTIVRFAINLFVENRKSRDEICHCCHDCSPVSVYQPIEKVLHRRTLSIFQFIFGFLFSGGMHHELINFECCCVGDGVLCERERLLFSSFDLSIGFWLAQKVKRSKFVCEPRRNVNIYVEFLQFRANSSSNPVSSHPCIAVFPIWTTAYALRTKWKTCGEHSHNDNKDRKDCYQETIVTEK